ncbi:MAG: hypothetical protein WDO73_24170 [Ignavibacteriota bacterium]
MDVEIAASLPKLKKIGKLTALRRVSALGRITYEKLRFEGDGTVKKQIINRYLNAEAEAQEDPSLAVPVNPENYNFKYKGRGQLDGRDIHLFEVSPKRKTARRVSGPVVDRCGDVSTRPGVRIPGEIAFGHAEEGGIRSPV